MASTATVGPAGFFAGPFAIHRGRPFGAWFEVLGLDGADSIGITTEMSEDTQNWAPEVVTAALVPGTRTTVYIAAPKRYARLVFAANACRVESLRHVTSL